MAYYLVLLEDLGLGTGSRVDVSWAALVVRLLARVAAAGAAAVVVVSSSATATLAGGVSTFTTVTSVSIASALVLLPPLLGLVLLLPGV